MLPKSSFVTFHSIKLLYSLDIVRSPSDRALDDLQLVKDLLANVVSGHLIRRLKAEQINHPHDAVHLSCLWICVFPGAKTFPVDPDCADVVVVRVHSKLVDLRAAETASDDELNVVKMVTHGCQTLYVPVESSWTSSGHDARETYVRELRDDVLPVSSLGKVVKGTAEDRSVWLSFMNETITLRLIQNDSSSRSLVRPFVVSSQASKDEGIATKRIHNAGLLKFPDRLTHLSHLVFRIDIIVRLVGATNFRGPAWSDNTAYRDMDLVSEILELFDFRGETANSTGAFAAEEETFCPEVGGFEGIVGTIDCHL